MAYMVDEASHLGLAEVKDIWFNCTDQLKDETGTVVDTVSSVDWSSDPDDLTIANDYINGVYIGAFVSAPTAETDYRVKAIVTTAAGRVFEALWLIAGVDKT